MNYKKVAKVAYAAGSLETLIACAERTGQPVDLEDLKTILAALDYALSEDEEV